MNKKLGIGIIVVVAIVAVAMFTGCIEEEVSIPTPTPSPTPTTTPIHSLDGFDEFIQKTLDDYEVPGAVVVVVQDDKVVFLKGYGVRELGNPAPVDENTRFQLASNTKLVTAAALGALVDEGKVKWDTLIIEYIPEFAMNDSYATLHATTRDMLAHRSGIRPYDGDLLNRLGYDRAEVLHRVRYLEPGCSFREKAAYSNIGFLIAGEVAARVDNSTWEKVVNSRLFQPLGMNRSSPYHDDMYKDENHVSGHMGYGDNLHVIPLESVPITAAAGEAISTGSDMARWLRMLLSEGSFEGKQILKPKTVQEIFRPDMVLGKHGPLGDPNGANGLGCDSFNFLGYTIVEKNGALDGVRTVVTLVPAENVGIAVMCNKHLTVFPEAVRTEFLERYLGPSEEDLQQKVREAQAMWNKLGEIPTPPENPGPLSLDLDAYTGVYNSELYGQFYVIRNDEKLRIEAGPNRYPGTLQHWTNNTFLLIWPDPDDTPGLITFIISPSGQVTGFAGEDYGNGMILNYGPFTRT